MYFSPVAASRPLYCIYRYTREARRPSVAKVAQAARLSAIISNRNRRRPPPSVAVAQRIGTEAANIRRRITEARRPSAQRPRAEPQSQQATGGGHRQQRRRPSRPPVPRWPCRIFAAACGRRSGRTLRRARPGVVFAIMWCLLST